MFEKNELVTLLEESVDAYCSRTRNDEFYKGFVLGQISFCFVSGIITPAQRDCYWAKVGFRN